MLKDIRSISIHGGNFETPTQLPLFCDSNNPAKAVLLYGRNGSGKSTLRGCIVNRIDIQNQLEIYSSSQEEIHLE